MTLNELLNQLDVSPETVEFRDVMLVVGANYRYEASEFSNGLGDELFVNAAGSNEGSCKIFAFGLLNELSPEQTLACFGKFYREDVLANPGGDDHQNIRTFIRHGWSGIVFSQSALSPNQSALSPK